MKAKKEEGAKATLPFLSLSARTRAATRGSSCLGSVSLSSSNQKTKQTCQLSSSLPPHTLTASVGVASNYSHPVETLIQTLSWFVPLGIVGALSGKQGMHVSTTFFYGLFRWMETVDAHSGYSLPFSPFTLIPIFGGIVSYRITRVQTQYLVCCTCCARNGHMQHT
jgi:hypothetical protein